MTQIPPSIRLALPCLPRRDALRPPALFLLALSACVAGLGCGSARTSPPSVQESSSEPASLIVRITAGQPFTAGCVLIERGATVEWRNLTPHRSVGVLSPREPYELSSPALLAPYNWVGPKDSDECARRVLGSCQESAPYSYWRHTFSEVGVFDYRDPGGSLASSSTGYSYGLPAGTATAPASVATGTVCVRSGLAGRECSQVCCTQASDCAEGIACIAGRCGGTP